jgi:hypothetical protein
MAPSPPRTPGLVDYAKRAFLFPWNMVLFLGAAVGAAASPWPDAVLPLITAAELAYLGIMTSMPKFRLAVDAEMAQKERDAQVDPTTGIATVTEMLTSLPFDDRARFEKLRSRCKEMRRLAAELQSASGSGAPMGDLRTSGLDQLLWGFLRLLRHHNALQKLLASMDEATIRQRLVEVQGALVTAQKSADERMIASCNDRLATAQQRLEYLQRTTKDAAFVSAELDRIEDKIQALSEMAVNQRDPDSLSTQIDAAAASLQHTESTINELQTMTGIADSLSAPPILDADIRTAAPIRIR